MVSSVNSVTVISFFLITGLSSYSSYTGIHACQSSTASVVCSTSLIYPIIFFANLINAEELELQSDEGRLQWFCHDEIKNLEMSFSAKYVMEHYQATGRFTDMLYAGATNENGVEFTELPEF